MTEREKYQRIYSESGTRPRYGHKNHGAAALPIVTEWAVTSLVDIGCGWNEFCKSVRAHCTTAREVLGIDFACQGADVNACATALPFEDKRFDALTAFDMLEHLLPSQVDAALKEFARVSRRFIFSICHKPSVHYCEGQNLHPTVRPEEWWISQIKKAGAGVINKSGKYLCGTWDAVQARTIAIYLNDCSTYHIGSHAVTETIRSLAEEAGMELDIYPQGSAVDKVEPGQIVLLNGEGTLHHNSKAALNIHATAAKLKQQGARLFLVNATVQNLDVDYSIFEQILVREGRSAAYLTSNRYRGQVRIVPDAVFCTSVPQIHSVKRHGIVFFDSVSNKDTEWLAAAAAEHHAPLIKLCEFKKSLPELLAYLQTKELVVTGRFHGAVFAMVAGTPFLAAPSNTWKTRGMLEDFGFSDFYCTNSQQLRSAIAERRSAVADPQRIAAIPNKWREFFQSLRGTEPQSHNAPAQNCSSDLCRRPALTSARAPLVFTERSGCPIAPGATCLLVGNGPSATNSRMGRIADAFEEVVRFNHYWIRDFTEQVGSRTTLWSTFGHGMLPNDSPPPARILFIHDKYGNPAAGGEVWRIPHAFYLDLRRRIRALNGPGSKVNPSSGCLVAHWLIAQGVNRIHLLGFDHFSKAHTKRHHYWLQKGFAKPRDHSGDAEAILFAQLRDAGRVSYL